MNNNNEVTILKLLKKSKTKSQGFSLLMDSFQEPLYWHIRRMVVRHEDAEDVLQECFINAYKYIDKFKGKSSLKTWLYKIATNEAIRFFNKRDVGVDSYDENERLLTLFEGDSSIDFEKIESQLQRAILSLPEKQRIVFNLRYYDELEYDDIAQITGSSVATLKTNYHYAAKKIKELMLNS